MAWPATRAGSAVRVADEHRQLRQCAVCSSTRLYRQRDLDRFLGLAVVVVAGVLVPFTYGITLPVVFPDRDLILYRRVAEMGVCYLCRVEYRGIKVPKRHPVVPPPPARQLREPHER